MINKLILAGCAVNKDQPDGPLSSDKAGHLETRGRGRDPSSGKEGHLKGVIETLL